jgi:hypothetical protein
MGKLDQKDIYNFIVESALYGNLGVFTGAGFSKDVLSDNKLIQALSWGELLKACCVEMKLKFDCDQHQHDSYPKIASMICEQYATENDMEYVRAVNKLKKTIATKTNWYPSEAQRKKYYDIFSKMKIQWYLTTNYDLLLEAVLSGEGLSLGINDKLIAPKSQKPIYHLHGIRLDPQSIVITQSDYLALFRPGNYRQLKLPLLIKESTVLLVGYGIGDVNVLTALDWSKNVLGDIETQKYPHKVIQLLYTGPDGEESCYEKDNILILETRDISKTLQKISDLVTSAIEEEKIAKTDIEELEKKFASLDKNAMRDFVDKDSYRKDIIQCISGREEYIMPSFLYFLGKILDDLKEKSHQDGDFSYYYFRLKILMDIIIAMDINKMPTALFGLLMDSFGELSPYIGRQYGVPGKAWQAGQYWYANKKKISSACVREMKNYFRDQWWMEEARALLEFDSE